MKTTWTRMRYTSAPQWWYVVVQHMTTIHVNVFIYFLKTLQRLYLKLSLMELKYTYMYSKPSILYLQKKHFSLDNFSSGFQVFHYSTSGKQEQVKFFVPLQGDSSLHTSGFVLGMLSAGACSGEGSTRDETVMVIHGNTVWQKILLSLHQV